MGKFISGGYISYIDDNQNKVTYDFPKRWVNTFYTKGFWWNDPSGTAHWRSTIILGRSTDLINIEKMGKVWCWFIIILFQLYSMLPDLFCSKLEHDGDNLDCNLPSSCYIDTPWGAVVANRAGFHEAEFIMTHGVEHKWVYLKDCILAHLNYQWFCIKTLFSKPS